MWYTTRCTSSSSRCASAPRHAAWQGFVRSPSTNARANADAARAAASSQVPSPTRRRTDSPPARCLPTRLSVVGYSRNDPLSRALFTFEIPRGCGCGQAAAAAGNSHPLAGSLWCVAQRALEHTMALRPSDTLLGGAHRVRPRTYDAVPTQHFARQRFVPRLPCGVRGCTGVGGVARHGWTLQGLGRGLGRRVDAHAAPQSGYERPGHGANIQGADSPGQVTSEGTSGQAMEEDAASVYGCTGKTALP
jgi:hypothetical protein